MREWEKKRLDALVEFLPARPIALKGDVEIEAVTAACLKELEFDHSGIKQARMFSRDVDSAKIRSGEILLSRSSTTDLVGRVSKFVGEDDRYCASDLVIRMAPRNGVNASYLSRYLSFLFVTGYWKTISSGASDSMKKIGREKLKSVFVPVPDLSIQSEIACTIDDHFANVCELIGAANIRRASSANFGKSILRSLFSENVPIHIGVPPAAPPRGWRWRRLTDLARLESGHTPSRKRPEWWGGDIPWIALPDIRALDGRVAMETARNTNEEGIANSSARVLPVDTIVVSRDVVVGFATILGKPMATSQHFVNWICGAEIEPRFLLHAFRASKDYLASQASGAIHQTLYMPAVKDFHLCLPDLPGQRRIAAALDEALAARQTLLEASRRELAAAEALPAAILREIFTDAA